MSALPLGGSLQQRLVVRVRQLDLERVGAHNTRERYSATTSGVRNDGLVAVGRRARGVDCDCVYRPGRLVHVDDAAVGVLLRAIPRRLLERAASRYVAELLPFAPQPESQSGEYDERHAAGPKRGVVVACRHSHLEENVKLLRKGDEPEQDCSGERRRLLHLSTLLPGAVPTLAPLTTFPVTEFSTAVHRPKGSER